MKIITMNSELTEWQAVLHMLSFHPQNNLLWAFVNELTGDHRDITICPYSNVSTIVPWRLRGIGSRTPTDTKIHECSIPYM